jgi:large subunit ribosomal protein L22
MEAGATLRLLRMAPRKVRLVADLVRGKRVEEALKTLRFTAKAASFPIKKLIESAVANAENNHGLDIDTLWVREIRVDEGPTLKRFRPRAQGRAFRIRKRTSHVSVVLAER